MSDFSVRADSVDVEQIMRQIRARIRDKRGVDYTEAQIQELANAKLDRFLDPGGVRSGLFEEFRRQAPPPPPAYVFEDTTLFDTDKGVVRLIRALFRPILKLFFNPNVLSSALHKQVEFNDYVITHVQGSQPLYFELLHNLVVETTRLGIEVKNLKMKVESLQSRLEFNERRARALEGVVQYKPDALERRGGESRPPARGGGNASHASHGSQAASPAHAVAASAPPPAEVPPGVAAAERTEPQGGVDPITGGDSLRTRRRRRRRGRRGQAGPGGAPGTPQEPGVDAGPDDGGDDGPDDTGGDHAAEASGAAASPAPAPTHQEPAAPAADESDRRSSDPGTTDGQ